MRNRYIAIFSLFVILLGIFIIVARKSKKKIGPNVAFVCCAMMVPIIGNIIICAASSYRLADTGYYIYFLGMDITMLSLYTFTVAYCQFKHKTKILKNIIYSLMALDVIQYILDLFTNHAFEIEATELEGRTYYKLIAFWGQTAHRILDYGILLLIILMLVNKIVRSSRIYAERYYIILFSLVVGAMWETFYIFSRTPIDRSMIGFGVFAILLVYFSLFYRPMRLLDSMLASIASELDDALFFFDGNDTCIWANNEGKKLVSLENNNFEAVKRSIRTLFPDQDWSGDEWVKKLENGSGDETRYFTLEKHTTYGERNRKAGAFLIVKDNTEQMKELEREKYNATHDSLTDLYTREYLYDRAEEEIKKNPDKTYFIVYADVSDFKMVNDIFGNDFGDVVLKYIAMKIRQGAPEGSIYGRLVSDTFGIVVPKADNNEERKAFVNDITRFTVSDGTNDQNILIHLGIYETNKEDNITIENMFDRARIALAPIKGDYQTVVAYYDEEMRKNALWGQHISTQLHTALAEKQIRPFLQPIVDRDGKVVGAEALVRWIHPEEGYLSPAKFIPVFEDNGMIADVDRYMWRSVCEILSRWKTTHKNFFISINISPKDFYFMDVVEEIKALVKEFDIEPEKLRIEITETIMMSENEQRLNLLEEFRNAGFIVEMDDFGSGYSSLNLLKDMPVDLIKVDMVFLKNSNEDEKSRIILKNILQLTEDLGLISLTEGVETEKQFKMLVEMGCKLFQGYYFSKPMSLNEFESFVKK